MFHYSYNFHPTKSTVATISLRHGIPGTEGSRLGICLEGSKHNKEPHRKLFRHPPTHRACIRKSTARALKTRSEFQARRHPLGQVPPKSLEKMRGLLAAGPIEPTTDPGAVLRITLTVLSTEAGALCKRRWARYDR